MTKTSLGISAFYHDSAAALVQDGRIIAAAQEERFTRKRHDPRFSDGAAHDFCAIGTSALAGTQPERLAGYGR